MSSNIASGPAPASSFAEAAPQKLKSSCDACSASKVRCESQKPTCSRCANMGHPCSYSAARRVGRRHGRGPSYAKKRAPVEPRHYPDLLPSSHITATTNTASRRASSTPSLSTTASTSASLEDSGGNGSSSTSLPRLEPQLPGKPSSSSSFSSSPSSSLFSTAAAGQGQKYPHFCGDLRDSASHGEVGRGLAPHVHHQHQQQQQLFDSDSFRPGLPELDMDMDVLMTCIDGGSGPKTNGSRAASIAGQGGGRSLIADCVGSTMAIQEQLEATNETLRRLLPGTGCGGGITSPDLNASGLLVPAVEVLGTACDRLATVLVCPCSAQLDTGLLVATACVSMLDVYRALLLVAGAGRGSSRSPSFARADPPGNDGNGSFFEKSWGVPDYFSVSRSSGASYQAGRRLSLASEEQQRLPGEQQGEAVMRIMEALPRAASLILQFAKRYKASDSTSSLRGSCSVAPGSSELLYALAAYLRVRLQRLTSEATEQLQCASWAGGI